MPSIFRRVLDKVKSRKVKDERDTEEPLAVSESSDAASGDGIGPLDFPDDCGGPASGVDLVFVHGLRGSRLKTWSRDNIFWPQDLLSKDLDNCRVITWGYDASIAKAFSYASKESLFGHAGTLLNDLARLRRGITRPIIFICHSLGGLVVKEALITSAGYKTHRRHPTLGEIYGSTIGVIFMGTPHRGSTMESYGEIAANVAKLSLRQPNKQLLQTLKPDSQILEKQRDGFTTVSNDISIVCIREELPTGAGMIVPEASASYDGFNVVRDAIHANHMDIARFVRRDDGYKRILGHIQDILDAKLPNLEEENEVLEARNNEILRALKFSTIDSREQGIDKAYAETCSWVWGDQSKSNGGPSDVSGMHGAPTESYELFSWLRNSEQLLWISGKAGCGKSTLMKHIYHDTRTRDELEKSSWADGKGLILLGYFFYDRGNSDQKSREGMLRSLLHRVLTTRRDLIPVVFPRGHFTGDYSPDMRIPAGFVAWPSLCNAFSSLLDHLRDYRMCLFLDGLDEYRMTGREDEYTEEELDLIYDGNNEDEAWGRSKWITDGHKEVAQFLRTFKSHRNVKVCISSRELVVFEHEFRNLPRIVVHTHTAGAIVKYCQGRLTNEVPDLMDLSDFVSTITAKSFGVFLWVQLVVDMLVDGHAKGNYKEELWKTLETVPERLGGKDGLYMHMMRNIEPQFLPESRRLFQLVMRWDDISNDVPHPDIITLFLAVPGHLSDDSTEGLRAVNDDYDLKCWSEWESRWKNLQKRLKSRCGGLLEGTDKVRFMHQTAKQFVSRTYLWPEIFRGAVGFTKEDQQDLALLSGLIRRLKCCSEAVIHPNSEPLADTDAQIEKTNITTPSTTSSVEAATATTSASVASTLSLVYEDEGPNIPYSGTIVPQVVSDIFSSIEWVTNRILPSPTLADKNDYSYMMLLDELDRVGNQLTHELRASKDLDPGWPGVYLGIDKRRSDDLDLGVKTLMELMIMIGHDSDFYVRMKIKNKGFSRRELTRLLLRATYIQTTRWRGGDEVGYTRHLMNTALIESLFQEGADPNLSDSELDLATTVGGQTVWTRLLSPDKLKSPYLRVLRNRIHTVRLFLMYGADPTARWYRPTNQKPNTSQGGSEIVTPEITLKELLGHRLECKKDLDDLLVLLRQKVEKGIAEAFPRIESEGISTPD